MDRRFTENWSLHRRLDLADAIRQWWDDRNDGHDNATHIQIYRLISAIEKGEI